MSVDHHSFALIGIGLIEEQWLDALCPKPIFKDAPGCGHKHSSKFCPECGVARKVSVQTNKKAIEEFYIYEELEKLAKRIKVPNLRLASTSGEPNFFCIGVGPEEAGGWDKPFAAMLSREEFSISHVHDSLKAKLEPLGAWSEKDFGLWVVHYCG